MATVEKKMGKLGVIKLYFGDRKEGGGATEWIRELKALSEAEKVELAQGAAKEMGLKADQCDFALKK